MIAITALLTITKKRRDVNHGVSGNSKNAVIAITALMVRPQNAVIAITAHMATPKNAVIAITALWPLTMYTRQRNVRSGITHEALDKKCA